MQNHQPEVITPNKERRTSRDVVTKGIRTSRDLVEALTCVFAEVVTGEMSPEVANTLCKSADRLIRVVELEQRYGRAEFRNVAPGVALF